MKQVDQAVETSIILSSGSLLMVRYLPNLTFKIMASVVYKATNMLSVEFEMEREMGYGGTLARTQSIRNKAKYDNTKRKQKRALIGPQARSGEQFPCLLRVLLRKEDC